MNKLSVWKNLSIRFKLIAVLGLIMILLFAGTVVTFVQLDAVDQGIYTLEQQAERAVMINEIGSLIRAKSIQVNELARNGIYNAEAYSESDERLIFLLNEVEHQMHTTEQHELFALIVQGNQSIDRIKGEMHDNPARSGSLVNELNQARELGAHSAVELSELVIADLNRAGDRAHEASLTAKLVLVISLSMATIIGIIIFVLLSNVIAKSLNQVAYIAEKVSKGDLQVQTIDHQSNDEIGRLGTAINEMVHNLKDLIHKISTTSEHVASSSEQLKASSEETSKATETITTSIQEVASGTESQVESTNNLNEAAIEISTGMEQVANNIQSVNEASVDMAQRAEEGTDVISKTINQMKIIRDKTNDTSAIVSDLGNKSTEIGNIINLITDVAEQTNLLALNAAIEAARAGEHGRGFAVVADEVRKLAEQSSKSAAQISALIQHIQTGINQSVDSMEEGQHAVREGAEFADEAGESFESIKISINEVTSQVQEVSAAVQQMTASTETMVKSIEETAEIAQQSAGYTQTVAASAEEQNASMEEVTASAETLSHTAMELQEAVSRFKL